ncbi:MAG: type II toxin-antitoxin system VapC family toxin [Candidatus Pacearchaeota archaeon]
MPTATATNTKMKAKKEKVIILDTSALLSLSYEKLLALVNENHANLVIPKAVVKEFLNYVKNPENIKKFNLICSLPHFDYMPEIDCEKEMVSLFINVNSNNGKERRRISKADLECAYAAKEIKEMGYAVGVYTFDIPLNNLMSHLAK